MTEPPVPTDPEPDDATAALAASSALRRVTKSTGRARPRTPRAKSASYSNDRDPQLLGESIDRLVRDQGWQDQSAVAVLMSEWSDIVGRDLAEHVTPVGFDAGELTVQADSTAWSKALQQLLPTLRRTIDERVGAGVVENIRIQGPYSPSWIAGSRRVKGRGPRDTYG